MEPGLRHLAESASYRQVSRAFRRLSAGSAKCTTICGEALSRTVSRLTEQRSRGQAAEARMGGEDEGSAIRSSWSQQSCSWTRRSLVGSRSG